MFLSKNIFGILTAAEFVITYSKKDRIVACAYAEMLSFLKAGLGFFLFVSLGFDLFVCLFVFSLNSIE